MKTIFLIFSSACLLGVFLFAHWKNIFTIQTIHCHIEEQECPADLKTTWEKNIGKSIFFTNYDNINEQITKHNPILGAVQIKKKLPNEVFVTYQRIPILYKLVIQTSPTTSILLVNKNGQLIASSETLNIISFQVPSELWNSLHTNSLLDPTLHQELTQFAEINTRQPLPIQTLTLTADQELLLQLTDGRSVQMRLDQVTTSIPKLNFLLQQGTPSNIKTPIKTIDLRFRYPILK